MKLETNIFNRINSFAEYQKLSNKINLRIKELYKEFVKTEEYNYFPDNLKEKMKNTYN